MIFNPEERERVKLANYTGSEGLNRGDIQDMLDGRGRRLRPDALIDSQTVSRIHAELRATIGEGGERVAQCP